MRQQLIFHDREEAGRLLTAKLFDYKDDDNALVLALPRGGVPVAYEVAVQLHLPLDVLLVRKLGVPNQEELAMGSIASGNVKVINDRIVDALQITPSQIAAIEKKELNELNRREAYYHRDNKPYPIAGKKIILVDDGIATGSTIKAAILAIKKCFPIEIILAVPVAPIEAIDELSNDVDKFIVLETPEPYYGVGMWYENFSQTTDEEVCELLTKASRPI